MKAEEINDDVEDEVEGDPDENEDVDQLAIDQAWIDGLSVNYPLYTYYKNLKTNFKIILGSDKIPEKCILSGARMCLKHSQNLPKQSPK